MDLFDKVISITDDLDKIVEVVCPKFRPPIYYMVQVFSSDWRYSSHYADMFIKSISKDKKKELATSLEELNRLIQLDKSGSIEGVVKSVLEYSYTFSFGKPFFKQLIDIFTPSSWSDKEANKIFTIGENVKEICNSISESKCYPDLAKELSDKSMIRPLTFGILAINKIVGYKLVRTELTSMEIVGLCLLYWTSILRYHLNNMASEVWLPEITELLARNGGRYFRLCKIKVNHEKDPIPLYKTLFPNTELTQAVMPDWHDNLYSSIRRAENISTYKGLHKLFLFHIIDQFVNRCTNTGKRGKIEDLFGDLQPYPDRNTLNRYVNLYLDKQIYSEKIDCSSWEPDKLLYELLKSHYPDYNDCLNAMRKEYFPDEMFDLNSLISASCEFYDDKYHLDVSWNKIQDSNTLDNISIWLTAEWIINNRHYPFLKGISLNELADMIGSAVTGYKQ